MGMYTEVFFRAEVSEDAASILEAMHEGEGFEAPDHEFFVAPRFNAVVNCGSYYFPGADHFVVEKRTYDRGRCVSFRSNLKNYDQEIQKFFDWIDPHVIAGPGEFIGYSLYEESETPTLFHKKGSNS